MSLRTVHRKKLVCLDDEIDSSSSVGRTRSEESINTTKNESENIWRYRGFKKITKGHIVFRNVSLEYESYPRFLNNVSFEIQAGGKVGIVGQNTADTNSIAIALYRLQELIDGKILVDGMDLSSIDIVEDVFIIQKDPVIYSNTIRGNVDLAKKFRDADIWNALEKVKIKGLMDKKKIGLDTEVNLTRLSSTKRQLLFLVQAIIKKPKILIIKENEESEDPNKLSILQEIVLQQFKNETVLILACHPRTINSCDKILCLENGEVVEEGEPSSLLKNPSSRLFHIVFNLRNSIIRRASEAKSTDDSKKDKLKVISNSKMAEKSDKKSLFLNCSSDLRQEIEQGSINTCEKTGLGNCEENAIIMNPHFKKDRNYVTENAASNFEHEKNSILSQTTKSFNRKDYISDINTQNYSVGNGQIRNKLKNTAQALRKNKNSVTNLMESKASDKKNANASKGTRSNAMERKETKISESLSDKILKVSTDSVSKNKEKIIKDNRKISSSDLNISKHHGLREYILKSNMMKKSEELMKLNKSSLGVNELPLSQKDNNFAFLKEKSDGDNAKVNRKDDTYLNRIISNNVISNKVKKYINTFSKDRIAVSVKKSSLI